MSEAVSDGSVNGSGYAKTVAYWQNSPGFLAVESQLAE